MERLILACVQQRMRLPQSIDEYKDDLRRFMRIAARKNARLIVFPELAGTMLVPPLLSDFRTSLLKRSDLGRRSRATTWQRLTGFVAGQTATLLNADMRRSTAALLNVTADDVGELYVDVFGGLAREFGITTVAPSAYLPDPVDGVIRNICGVFGTSGEPLGWQSKVVLHPLDSGLAQPGSTWDVIATDVGRLGIMLGSDVLYPEVGRVLAYQGAEFLISSAACTDLAFYNKVRSGMLARMQDNQLFGVSSFLVGNNELLNQRGSVFMGRSAVFAPQELTPRYNGVLVEMGNHRSEGVLTAEWDFAELRELWETTDAPVRQQMPLEQVGPLLSNLYQRLQQLPRLLTSAQLSGQVEESDPSEPEQAEERKALPPSDPDATTRDAATKDATTKDATTESLPAVSPEPSLLTLDELPVLSSVTSRWPVPKRAPLPLFGDELDASLDIHSLAEEETEEIDALSDDPAKG